MLSLTHLLLVLDVLLEIFDSYRMSLWLMRILVSHVSSTATGWGLVKDKWIACSPLVRNIALLRSMMTVLVINLCWASTHDRVHIFEVNWHPVVVASCWGRFTSFLGHLLMRGVLRVLWSLISYCHLCRSVIIRLIKTSVSSPHLIIFQILSLLFGNHIIEVGKGIRHDVVVHHHRLHELLHIIEHHLLLIQLLLLPI